MKISPITAGLPAHLTARINFRQMAAQKAARPVRPVDHAPTGRQLPDFKLAKPYQLQTVCSSPAHWPTGPMPAPTARFRSTSVSASCAGEV